MSVKVFIIYVICNYLFWTNIQLDKPSKRALIMPVYLVCCFVHILLGMLVLLKNIAYF